MLTALLTGLTRILLLLAGLLLAALLTATLAALLAALVLLIHRFWFGLFIDCSLEFLPTEDNAPLAASVPLANGHIELSSIGCIGTDSSASKMIRGLNKTPTIALHWSGGLRFNPRKELR